MNQTILASLLLLIGACATGPTAADVAADRDRWRAVSDTTADKQVDATESPLLTTLLIEWDAKLTADEKRIASADTTWQDLARAYGGAAVTVLLAEEIKLKAPELFRLVDRDSDGMLSIPELEQIDPTSPVFATAVVTTAVRLIVMAQKK